MFHKKTAFAQASELFKAGQFSHRKINRQTLAKVQQLVSSLEINEQTIYDATKFLNLIIREVLGMAIVEGKKSYKIPLKISKQLSSEIENKLDEILLLEPDSQSAHYARALVLRYIDQPAALNKFEYIFQTFPYFWAAQIEYLYFLRNFETDHSKVIAKGLFMLEQIAKLPADLQPGPMHIAKVKVILSIAYGHLPLPDLTSMKQFALEAKDADPQYKAGYLAIGDYYHITNDLIEAGNWYEKARKLEIEEEDNQREIDTREGDGEKKKTLKLKFSANPGHMAYKRQTVPTKETITIPNATVEKPMTQGLATNSWTSFFIRKLDRLSEVDFYINPMLNWRGKKY